MNDTKTCVSVRCKNLMAVKNGNILSCGLWRRVDSQADKNVPEKGTAKIFNPDDGDSMFFRNFSIYLHAHKNLQHGRDTSM